MSNQEEVFVGEPLDAGRAETLLCDAWVIDAGSAASVVAACLHRVLVLEVELDGPAAYREAPTARVRKTLVGTFEPLRTCYELELSSANLAWQQGSPPPSLDARVSTCLAANDSAGARVVRWAEDEVAEIALGGDVHRKEISKIRLAFRFVGVSPPRLLGVTRPASMRQAATALAIVLGPMIALMLPTVLRLSFTSSPEWGATVGITLLANVVLWLGAGARGKRMIRKLEAPARRRLAAAGAGQPRFVDDRAALYRDGPIASREATR